MKTVAVIFGGRSAEHDVSIITAHIPIIDSLKAAGLSTAPARAGHAGGQDTAQAGLPVQAGGFDIWPVYITKEGDWYADKAMDTLSFFKQNNYADILRKQKKIRLLFDGGLYLIWPGLREKKTKIDVVFSAMHGTYGEDGSLMGLLRMAKVPFVGCDMASSAVAMDKAFTKQVLSAEGIPVVPFVWFTKSEYKKSKRAFLERIAKLTYPLFVKPVHLGSSIGISKVKDAAELPNAIEVAFHYDDKVLVEEGVENLIEVTLPIMGNNEVTLASVERPLNKTEFFDFKDKYLSGGLPAATGTAQAGLPAQAGKGSGVNSEYSEIPAKIEDYLVKQVQELGKKTYKTLGCSGIARVDFLIDSSSKRIFVNEVNTLPGSLYHHNWRKSGVSGVELVTKLITLAEERFAAEQKLTHTFSSDILTKISGPKVQN